MGRGVGNALGEKFSGLLEDVSLPIAVLITWKICYVIVGKFINTRRKLLHLAEVLEINKNGAKLYEGGSKSSRPDPDMFG